MEQLEKQDKTVRKLKKQLKVFAKKIGELEGNVGLIVFAQGPNYIAQMRLRPKQMAQPNGHR